MNPLIYIVEDDEGVPVIIVSAKSDEISFVMLLPASSLLEKLAYGIMSISVLFLFLSCNSLFYVIYYLSELNMEKYSSGRKTVAQAKTIL